MGQARGELPDGTQFEFEVAGEVPTAAEYDNAVRMLEVDLASRAEKQPERPAPRTAFMEPRGERDILESNLTRSDAVLRSARESLAETVSNEYSGIGGFAGGLAGAKAGAAVGAPLGPGGAAAGGVIGGLVGGAAGSFAGKAGGYHLPYAPENAVDFEDQLDRSFEAAQNDLMISGAFSLAGAGLRVGRNVARGSVEGLVTSFSGYRSPEVRSRIMQAREFGLRLTPADIHPKFAKVYGAIFGNVPAISSPLRAAQKRRAEEAGVAMRSLIGPLESGMNEVTLGKNFLKAATNAVRVRKDWYERIYKKTDDYMLARPDLRVSNDAIDAARTHIYEQASRSRPVVSSSQTARTVTRDVRSSGTSETAAQTLRARNEGYDWRVEVDPATGQRYRVETEVLPGAQARDMQTGTIKEGSSATRSTILQSTEDHYTVGGFRTPGNVNQFIEDTMNSPQQLTYKQYKGLRDDIEAALDVADPTQSRTLLQMKENLDTAIDNIGDDGARQLLRRSRNTYRQVMEFFENPTSATFAKVDPSFASNVKGLHRGNTNIPSLMSSELFSTLFKDLSPEGVKELSKQVGARNMQHATERWVGETFEHAFQTNDPVATKVDWNGLRREFGLHSPTSARYASTRELLKTGQYKWDIDKVGRFIDTMEREVGPEIPDLAKMYVRGAVFSGPKAGLNALFATHAFRAAGKASGVLTGPKAVAMVLGFRKLSSFLGNPDRLNAMNRALESSVQPAGVGGHFARQVVRYLAAEMWDNQNPGQDPTQTDIDLEENRLMGVAGEAGFLEQNGEQSRMPAPRLGDF